MRKLIFIIANLFADFISAQKENLAPSMPAVDEYFGNKIVDEYRNLEDLNDSSTLNWMKSQTNFSRSIIDKIPNKDFYLKKRLEFDKKQGYSVSDLCVTSNDKYFYLKKNADEKTAKVYFRNGFDGKEKLLYDPANFVSTFFNSTENHQYIVNLLSPSWDGNKLAISITKNGKGISEVIVIDVEKKYVYPEIISNTDPSNIGGIRWLEDNSGFFYISYPTVDSGSKEYGKNTQSVLYKLGDSPDKLNVVFSNFNNPNLKIDETAYPAILAFNPDDKYYVGILVDSEDFRRTFIISKRDLIKGKNSWKQLYTKDDKVYNITLVNNDIYFLSGYNSSNYKLCKTTIQNPNFKNPEVLIPENGDEVIKGYKITKDGIYFTRIKNGVEAKLYLLKSGNEINNIKTPFVSGDISLDAKGKKFSDIWITCSGWANSQQRFRYNLQNNSYIAENFAPVIEYPEFNDIIVEEITVKSYDGVEVPLSLIYNKNIKKDSKTPILLNGYGAFAESFYPYFSISYLLWVKQGGMVAVPHVRGGGEKGEQWHLDGQKLKKPNSWKDLIACTDFLIQEKYTSSNKIALLGGSAGGVLMGRAMIERPDLFGAVIIESGNLNTLRKEISGGTGNTTVQEYGSVNDLDGFKSLREMDAYFNIKKNTNYPATLITAGINDPIVTPWISAKFAAKLLAYNASENPVLLKIDYEGGHATDIPLVQRYSNLGDIFAFAFWQLGHPSYQPKD